MATPAVTSCRTVLDLVVLYGHHTHAHTHTQSTDRFMSESQNAEVSQPMDAVDETATARQPNDNNGDDDDNDDGEPGGRSWLDALEDFCQLSDASSNYSDDAMSLSSDDEDVDDDEDEDDIFAADKVTLARPAARLSPEVLQEQQRQYCPWRSSPEESHSDFSILVRRKDNNDGAGSAGAQDVYHVHKVYLAVGDFKSSYLETLFSQRGGSFVETTRRSVTLEMANAAADAFPILLDFAYSKGSIQEFDTHNATGLIYLSDYLGMPLLAKKTKAFIVNDMNLENSHIYYKDALELHQMQIIAQVEKKVTMNLGNMFQFQLLNLLEVITVSSVVEILSSEEILKEFTESYTKEDSESTFSFFSTPRSLSNVLSNLICSFLHLQAVSVEDFDLLTNEENLPSIDVSVATKLIEFEETIKGASVAEQETCLKKRCWQAIRENFHKTDFESPENEVAQFLRRQPSEIAVNTLLECMTQLKKT